MKSYHDYEPRAVTPVYFADVAHEEEALQEVTDQCIAVALNGQQFSGIHGNRDVQIQAIIRPNSLFGNTANADQQYIAMQYMAAFPDHAYMSLDLPGHGSSDRLTKDQRDEISDTNGRLSQLGQAQLEAAVQRLPDLKRVVLTGEAMGSLMALEFAVQAAAKGIHVRHVFGFDPLGMEDRSAIKLAAGYLTGAQRSRFERRKDADNEDERALEDAFSKVFVPAVEAVTNGTARAASRVGHAGIMARERSVLTLMFKQSPITHSSGMRALTEVLQTTPGTYASLVFTGRSVVGRLTDPVYEQLTELAIAHNERLVFMEWPHDNQDIGLARHQPRLVRYLQDQL